MKGRFARIPEHALKANLTARALRVLIAISLHADPNGWAWPSLDTIAELTGIDRRDVLRAITELEMAGVIHRHRTAGGPGNPTRYQIVGMPKQTGGKSPPDMSINRGQITPCSGLGTGGDLTPEQGVNHPPEHTNRTEEDSERARVCESFMRFRSAYPSRGDHGDPEKPARLEFEAALDRGVAAKDIIVGAERYAAEVSKTRTEPRYVKMAVNWLRNESWNDEARPVPRRRPVAGMA